MEQLFFFKPKHVVSCAETQTYHTLSTLVFHGKGQGTEQVFKGVLLNQDLTNWSISRNQN